MTTLPIRSAQDMTPIQIVIDTNVLVTAVRSNRGASFALLDRLGDSCWRPNVSTALVLEYESALKREFVRQGRNPALADDLLNVVLEVANRRAVFFRWQPFLPDPQDDFVLELAVASGARFIVTYNSKHLYQVL